MMNYLLHIALIKGRQLFEVWLILAFCLATQILYGQHEYQFSQYFSNQLVINPAYAGTDDALSLTLVHRNQWSGVKGSPKTTTLSGHTLFKNTHTGIGLSLFVDQINIHSNVNFLGIYSYRIQTGSNSYLSMGLQAGIAYVKSDYASLSGGIHNPIDPGLSFQENTQAVFQFGTGIYFKNPRLELGLSAPILYTSGALSYSDTYTAPISTPHYFLFSRYKITVNKNVKVNPGFLIKYKSGWPLGIDLNVDALINEVLMVGLSYRSFESLSAIIQMKVLPQMKLGYSYDVPINSIQPTYFNSHEIMLNYIFHYKNYSAKDPR